MTKGKKKGGKKDSKQYGKQAGQKPEVVDKGYKPEKAGSKFCDMPLMAPRVMDEGVDPMRAAFVVHLSDMWVNGTVIHYCFFEDGKHGSPAHWSGRPADKTQVRKAFQQWKDLGIGLEFKEVDRPQSAEIRIGFSQGEGSWSYLGTYPINRIGADKRTMNFGWSLTTSHGKDTALHEIGHALGAKHEHQNPIAGIQWDRQAVYSYFSGPPNSWSHAKIDHNILNQVAAHEVDGSQWDSNSIMHYEFHSALVDGPAPFDSTGIHPADGLSTGDKAWAKKLYPPLLKKNYIELKPFRSERLHIEAGEQVDLLFKPPRTRKYRMQTSTLR